MWEVLVDGEVTLAQARDGALLTLCLQRLHMQWLPAPVLPRHTRVQCVHLVIYLQHTPRLCCYYTATLRHCYIISAVLFPLQSPTFKLA